MMTNLWKSGHSGKPTICHQIVLYVYLRRFVLLALLGAFVSLSSFYGYLDRRYLLDGPFDISGPKELSEKDKLSIRVVAPPKLETLVAFVGHYSICPVVDRIIVLWHSSTEIPKDDVFQYTTTHSKVNFQLIQKSNFWPQLFSSENVNTPGVLSLDSHTFVSCEQLSFSNNVWRSSVDGLVGFMPNLVQYDSFQKMDVQKSAKSVVWESFYNTLHWDGLVFSSNYLEKLNSDKELLGVVTANPQCSDMLIPLYVLKQSKMAPIWVDVDISSGSNSPFSLSKMMQSILDVSNKDDSKCITILKSALKIEELPKSYTCSRMAKSFWTW